MNKTSSVKSVSAMTLRRHVGALLDEVRLQSRTVIVERAGKPIAKITPLFEGDHAATGDERRRLQSLDRLVGLSGVTVRGRDPGKWLARERDAWGGRER